MSKNHVLQQATYRNLEIGELRKLSNKEIFLILINFRLHSQGRLSNVWNSNNQDRYRELGTVHQVLMSQHLKHPLLISSEFDFFHQALENLLLGVLRF